MQKQMHNWSKLRERLCDTFQICGDVGQAGSDAAAPATAYAPVYS